MTLALVLAGCTVRAAPYSEREAFLDRMTAEGVEYRSELLRQATPISDKACAAGWVLLSPNVPYDEDGPNHSKEWLDQVEEAYMKGCLTGQLRPKPDPSGVKAVTPVPHGSESPLPSPSGSPSPSASGP